MTSHQTPLEPARTHTASGEETGACVLAVVLGSALGEDPTTAMALAAQRQRLAAFRDPTSDEALAELTRQLPTLEALWQRFALAAVDARKADDKVKLLRVALQAQQAYARTFALVRGLALQARSAATVTVLHDDDGSLEDDFDSDSDSDNADDLDRWQRGRV
jgi:hypothetical protein